jgi:hypothetical protein
LSDDVKSNRPSLKSAAASPTALSNLVAIAMMLASWTWTTRARYDLYDRSADPLPFQVSLRQMIIAVTVIAVALTYWRAFGD